MKPKSSLLRPFLFLLAALPLAAQTVAPARSSQVLERRIESASLKGNLLGDQPGKRLLVYLPPGYEAEAERRYPVLYVLHGIFDQPDVWVEFFAVPGILDRLIEKEILPPLIAVFPEGFNKLGGGFYRNSPVSGNWSDLIASELPEYIDSRFRTEPRAESRALIGHSMGGYGAIHMAMTRPEVFSIAYAMSPCCLTPIEDAGQGNPVWRRVESLTGWAEVEKGVQERDFYLVAALGILTAFFPNPERPPFYVDLPYQTVRGEIIPREENYRRFLRQFPLHHLEEAQKSLLSIKALGMDYGIGDQFAHIPTGTRLFSQRLSELRIPHTLEVYDGDHRQQLARRLETAVLPWVGRYLTK